MRGVWCLHCERAWHGEWRECPADDCDGGFMDMFEIYGEFEEGTTIQMDEPLYDELRGGARGA